MSRCFHEYVQRQRKSEKARGATAGWEFPGDGFPSTSFYPKKIQREKGFTIVGASPTTDMLASQVLLPFHTPPTTEPRTLQPADITRELSTWADNQATWRNLFMPGVLEKYFDPFLIDNQADYCYAQAAAVAGGSVHRLGQEAGKQGGESRIA